MKVTSPKHNKPPAYSDEPRLPVGHPESAVVCGLVGCRSAALIWLKEDEEQAYLAGERIFDIRTNAAKVKVL
ncbi:MAG TPA: hypothetical protein VGA18_09995 [Rhodothermales bacterium]